jgi:hypothetical protein
MVTLVAIVLPASIINRLNGWLMNGSSAMNALRWTDVLDVGAW